MTSTDERLERYLHDRSTAIDLPHAGVDAITRRARRHRRRRTAARGGVAAALLLGGVAAAGLTGEDPQEEVGSVGAAVVDSPLEWSVVPVGSGLGGGSSAVSDGSAVYSLSTAAGSDLAGSMDEPRHLYRSADGTDWEDVGLPHGLHASSVSAAGGSVYAVGTAAAGGGVPGVELAVSGDGGEDWDTSSVPLDLDGLADGFPGRVRAIDAEVAVSGGTTVVAVSVAGSVDPAAVLAAADDPGSWYQERRGLIHSAAAGCSPEPDPAVPAPTTTGPSGTTATAPASSPAAGPAGEPGDCAPGRAAPPEIRTWSELGLTPEQVALAQGQMHLFVAPPDGPLEPVHVIQGAASTSAGLVAADDGWWIIEDVISERDAAGFDISTDVVAWHSADGRAWTTQTLASRQTVLSAGVVGGRAVVVALEQDPGAPQVVHVHRIEAGGRVTSVDLNRLVGISPRSGIFASGVGPLGVAVVMGDAASGEEDGLVLVTSLDGLRWSTQALPEAEPGTWETVNGITVTPDAIKVRLNAREDGATADEPSSQRLFVGTPTG